MFGMKKELQCIRREYQEKLRMIKEAHKTEHNAINAKHQEELESLDKNIMLLKKGCKHWTVHTRQSWKHWRKPGRQKSNL